VRIGVKTDALNQAYADCDAGLVVRRWSDVLAWQEI
jgi:hypothetical protein